MINGALKHLSVWVSVFQSNYEKNGLGWNGNISRANYCLILTRADLRPNKNDAIHEVQFKVIRKVFLKHNKSFRWHLGDYEKHNFSPFEGL